MVWTTFLFLFAFLCALEPASTTTITTTETTTKTVTSVIESSVETTAPEASETAVDTADPTAETSGPTAEAESTAESTAETSGSGESDAPEASGTEATATEATGTETPSETTSAAGDDAAHKVALYFTNWGIYGADYHPSDLPVDQVTHVLYAFADIGPDGEVTSSDPWADTKKRYEGDSSDDGNAYGCVGQLNLLKRKNRQLKLLLSVGGWNYSQEGKFVGPASTEEGRQRFASSAVKLVADWGFDGLDVDWEYPENAQEAQDYVSLLKACRKALDEYAAENAPGYHFLLTVASSAGPDKIETMDLAGMDPLLDFWNLMAYDYAGSWDSTSGHQAAFHADEDNPETTKFSTAKAVNMYIESGVNPSKVVLGMPLYGRSFQDTEGLGKLYNGVGTGSIQSGVWLYKDLPRPGASEHFIDTIVAAYSYDPESRELVSYDNSKSVEEKAQLILGLGLGGGFFWEASGDKAGDESLVGVFSSIINQTDSGENLISYPASQYGNIRNGTED